MNLLFSFFDFTGVSIVQTKTKAKKNVRVKVKMLHSSLITKNLVSNDLTIYKGHIAEARFRALALR